MKVTKAIKRVVNITRITGCKQKTTKEESPITIRNGPCDREQRRYLLDASAHTINSRNHRYPHSKQRANQTDTEGLRIDKHKREKRNIKCDRLDDTGIACDDGDKINESNKTPAHRHRSLLKRLCHKRLGAKTAAGRNLPKQNTRDNLNQEGCHEKRNEYIPSQMQQSTREWPRSPHHAQPERKHLQLHDRSLHPAPGCFNQTENNILYSSGSSFDATWSYQQDSSKETFGSMPISDKNASTSRSRSCRSESSRTSLSSFRSPKEGIYSRNANRDESSVHSRRASKIQPVRHRSKERRKDDSEPYIKENRGLSSRRISDALSPNEHDDNDLNLDQCNSSVKKNFPKSSKKTDARESRSKNRKNSRSKSLPPVKAAKQQNQKSVESKSPRRRLPIDRSPTKRKPSTRNEPTNTASRRPLQQQQQQQQEKHCSTKKESRKKEKIVVEEKSQGSRTDRTARTAYTTSSAGPIESSPSRTSNSRRARTRSISRKSSGARTRSSSRAPRSKSRARSSSRKRRSSNRKMIPVEDAQELLHPKNHPTYLIQPVVSSSDEEEEEDGRDVHQPNRRRQKARRSLSKDRGFSALHELPSRKGRRPNRHSEGTKTPKRESSKIASSTASPKTLSSFSSRRIQRSSSIERRRREKRSSSRSTKIHGEQYLSHRTGQKYPNPFVKPQ